MNRVLGIIITAPLVLVLGCESKTAQHVPAERAGVAERSDGAPAVARQPVGDPTSPSAGSSSLHHTPQRSDERVIVYETPVVMEAPDEEIVQRVTGKHMGQIRGCYERALLKSPELSGTVTVKYVIAATGKVTNASIARSDLNSAPVHSCIEKALLRWRFPPPEGGGPVLVTYPFVFKARGGEAPGGAKALDRGEIER